MKYTELLTEYVESNGGVEQAFPALFYKVPEIAVDDITVKFAETFYLHFCEREIGFETEALFALKLEATAQRFIPALISAIKALRKVDVSAVAGSLQSSFVYPETGSASVEADPSALREQTSVRSEENAVEQSDTAEDLARREKDLWEEAFKKFENLFMQIF